MWMLHHIKPLTTIFFSFQRPTSPSAKCDRTWTCPTYLYCWGHFPKMVLVPLDLGTNNPSLPSPINSGSSVSALTVSTPFSIVLQDRLVPRHWQGKIGHKSRLTLGLELFQGSAALYVEWKLGIIWYTLSNQILFLAIIVSLAICHFLTPKTQHTQTLHCQPTSTRIPGHSIVQHPQLETFFIFQVLGDIQNNCMRCLDIILAYFPGNYLVIDPTGCHNEGIV